MNRTRAKLWFDRLIYGGSLKQITVLLIATLVVFYIVGGLMVVIFEPNIGHARGIDRSEHMWQLYYYFVDSGNQMSMDGKAPGSRIIGLIMSTLGSIFLAGLLISTITNIIERRAEECREGRNYYKFSDHTVIIGSDQMIHGILKQVLATDVKHAVVLTSGDVEGLRQEIQATLRDKKTCKRVIVNYGTRDSENFLRKINVTAAREVYILGDFKEFDEIECYHDSLNVECLQIIAGLCKETGRMKLPCNVSFDYKTTYHVFQYADLSAEITEYVDFHPFNFDEFWAQKVLVAGVSPDEDIKYLPLDYKPIISADSDDYVHFIIIGLSHMGQAMALQAAHICHFPNYRRRKTRITIIDRNMKREMDEFKQKCGALFEVAGSTFIDADKWEDSGVRSERHYHINEDLYGHLVTDTKDKNFIDIDWTFVKGDDSNPKVRQLLQEYAQDPHAILTMAVCLNITHCSLRSAMFLPNIFYERDIPILVQQRNTESLVDTLNGKNLASSIRDRLKYKNIKPFGMVYDCYDISMAMSIRYCKRINAAYSYFFMYRVDPAQIDDVAADALWDELKTSKRWSNVFAAASIPTKLRCMGYNTERMDKLHVEPLTPVQVDILAQMEHNRWAVEELLLGYRPVTAKEDADIDADPSRKSQYRNRYIHYDIRPYDGLKPDASGQKANVYDEMIVRCIPLIINT